MGKMRKVGIICSFLLCGLVYYMLFFTSVLSSYMRELAYILSGYSIDGSKSLSESAKIVTFLGEKAYPIYQSFSATFIARLQYGPYMNLTVYIIALFSVVPLFLIAKLLQNYNRQLNVKEEMQYLKNFRKHFFNYLIFAFITSGIGSMISVFLAALFLKSSSTSANQAAIQSNLQTNFIITAIPIIILAPIVEEVVFRGVLLSGIKRILDAKLKLELNPILISKKYNITFTYSELGSLLFSSTLFALIHLSTNINQWPYFPVYFCGGIALGSVYIINRERIYSSIFIHAAYNAIPVIMTTIIRLIVRG